MAEIPYSAHHPSSVLDCTRVTVDRLTHSGDDASMLGSRSESAVDSLNSRKESSPSTSLRASLCASARGSALVRTASLGYVCREGSKHTIFAVGHAARKDASVCPTLAP